MWNVQLHNKNSFLPVSPRFLPVAENRKGQRQDRRFSAGLPPRGGNRVNDLPQAECRAAIQGNRRELEERGRDPTGTSVPCRFSLAASWASTQLRPFFRILDGDGTFSWIAGRLPSIPRGILSGFRVGRVGLG